MRLFSAASGHNLLRVQISCPVPNLKAFHLYPLVSSSYPGRTMVAHLNQVKYFISTKMRNLVLIQYSNSTHCANQTRAKHGSNTVHIRRKRKGFAILGGFNPIERQKNSSFCPICQGVHVCFHEYNNTTIYSE